MFETSDEGLSAAIVQRAAIEEAQRRLAYLEQLGKLVEQQMISLAGRAATLAEDGGREQSRLLHEIDAVRAQAAATREEMGRFASLMEQQIEVLARRAEMLSEEHARRQRQLFEDFSALRSQGELLRGELAQRAAQAAEVMAQVNVEAERTVSKAREVAESIVRNTMNQLESVRREVTGSEARPEPAEPPATEAETGAAQASARAVGSTPTTSSAPAESPANGVSTGSAPLPPRQQEAVTPPAKPEPAAAPSAASSPATAGPAPFSRSPSAGSGGQPVSVSDGDGRAGRATVGASAPPQVTEQPASRGESTLLRIKGAVGEGQLEDLSQKLQERPGIHAVAVASASAEGAELRIEHAAETSVLGTLLAIVGLDLRLMSVSEGFFEVELGGR